MTDPVRDMKETYRKTLFYFESVKEDIYTMNYIPSNKKDMVHGILFRGDMKLFKAIKDYVEHLQQQ